MICQFVLIGWEVHGFGVIVSFEQVKDSKKNDTAKLWLKKYEKSFFNNGLHILYPYIYKPKKKTFVKNKLAKVWRSQLFIICLLCN